MYAVIRAGGKQYKVAKGDVIEVERLEESADEVTFSPLLVVDDKGKTRAGPSELSEATVRAKILGEGRGRKVHVYKYRSKSGYRRHAGHRQAFTSLEISDIKVGRSRSRSKKQGADDGA